MEIRELIIWSIDLYHGSENRIIKYVLEHIGHQYKKESEAKKVIYSCISWLNDNGYIAVVPRSEMDEDQRRYYESDHCTIYKVIKKYDEMEYLKEKYGN